MPKRNTFDREHTLTSGAAPFAPGTVCEAPRGVHDALSLSGHLHQSWCYNHAMARGRPRISFAVIRYNCRTYESGGVMAVVKGQANAARTVEQFENRQTDQNRHAGWRYFLEVTDFKPGMDPEKATTLRQIRLEIRESK